MVIQVRTTAKRRLSSLYTICRRRRTVREVSESLTQKHSLSLTIFQYRLKTHSCSI